MQQFFCDVPLKTGTDYIFTAEQAHHGRDVARLQNETVRLVYQGQAYFARTCSVNGQFAAHIEKEDPHVNELPAKLILAMALIRKEKMELVYQKAAELGATEIVPFVSSRCVVKDDGRRGKMERRRSIVKSAAEQCKRNLIPEVHETIRFEQLECIEADVKAAAYENARQSGIRLSQLPSGRSICVVIGPEGGFSEEENAWLNGHGFVSVSLGSRILRAETAALYACSVIGEWMER